MLDLNGEQVLISNTNPLKQVVKTYKRMEARRIVFKSSVTYSASPEQAEAIRQLVK